LEKSVIHWKIEAVILIFTVTCISLSFYLAFLSFQTLDEALRKQLVTFAASFLVMGMVIFAALTVHIGIKKVFSRMEKAAKSEMRTSMNNAD
jgi:hypothetical protein